ncbi:MAG: class II aldolase/adducin family protein [Planctomycetes bacterium]|nr:class II aldolase/adducin family protein [Planctomycetota bacterium]
MKRNRLQAANQICEAGRRLYSRGFAAGNDGNISFRIDEKSVLCTPTLICKGYMTPGYLCTVDLDGNQLSGKRKRTSEIFLHLEVYRGNPNVAAVVHCHPPHATAFAIAHEPIPTGIIPEVEVFLGVVPHAPYETPGGRDFAATIRPFTKSANTVVLSNHGTVSWGPSVERAYWCTEILDAYCRMLILAKLIGGAERLPPKKVRELLALRPAFGMPPDERSTPAELYVNPAYAARKAKRPRRDRRRS